MKYELNDPNRTPEWYYQAGASMAQKIKYMNQSVQYMEQMLYDPEKQLSWSAKKDMQREISLLRAACKKITDTYSQRCIELREHPELLRGFKDGFLGL